MLTGKNLSLFMQISSSYVLLIISTETLVPAREILVHKKTLNQERVSVWVFHHLSC